MVEWKNARLLGGLALAAVLTAPASRLLAQTAPTPTAPAGPGAAQSAAPDQPKAAPKAKPAIHKAKKKASDDEDADEDDADNSPASKVSEVVVQARRTQPQIGAVVGDIKPELQLSPADIQSYGVSTVTELLNELAPQTRSDRGRAATSPVVLLNGHRISSLREVQNIPTEAILRVDILPEEVSLKYGYSADQRVVNIVLKRYFKVITGELVGGETTAGGDATGQAEADQFQVRRDNRLNLDLKYQSAAGLTYADRDLTPAASGAPYDFTGNVVSATRGGQIDPALSALAGQPVTVAGVPASAANGLAPSLADFLPTAGIANVSDTAADHSLAPATQALTANAVYARPIFWGVNATVNASLGYTTSAILLGLPGVSLTVPAGDPFSPFSTPVVVDRYVAGARALEQTADGWTAHLGTTLNRDKGDWRLSLTDAYDHSDTVTETGTGLNVAGLQSLLNQGSTTTDPFGSLPLALLSASPSNSARALSDSGNIQILANGPLWQLPAGALYVSAKLGDTISREQSTSARDGLTEVLSLSRNDVQGRLNIDVPLASRTRHVLSALGELSFNVNSAIDDYSDFGALPTLGFGINWTPIPGYNLIISETHDHAAPTIQQLDGPVIQTPGATVFDYQTGQTVNVTQISGSNPNLKADDRQIYKVGLTLKPFTNENFTFTANYIYSHINNPIETFPSASAAIEAAYPDRFVRDASGELVEEDITPVNFASQDREEIRWGFNWSRPIGKQPPPRVFDRRAFAQRRPPTAGAAGSTGSAGAPAPPGARPARGLGGGGLADDEDENTDQPTNGPNAPGAGADSEGAGPHVDGGTGFPRGGGGGGFGGDGGGRGGGGRGGFGGGNAPVGGRLQIALYHTIIFKDQFLVRPGGPVLDLLNGAAAGGAGGQYQHEIEAQLGYTDNGYGVRFSADWRSATVVTGGASGSTGNLDFSDVGTINIRLWDDFTQQKELLAHVPVLSGTRLTLSVTNLFDQIIRVHDTAGPTPLIYQAAYLNPTGRVVSINLRKQFY